MKIDKVEAIPIRIPLNTAFSSHTTVITRIGLVSTKCRRQPTPAGHPHRFVAR
jgi:hypothetical protein